LFIVLGLSEADISGPSVFVDCPLNVQAVLSDEDLPKRPVVAFVTILLDVLEAVTQIPQA